jgi:sulfate transport system permease protein
MGEFGAVSVVSGHITGETETMPLRVQGLFEQSGKMPAAFALASLLALLALVTLCIKVLVEWKTQRNYDAAQRAAPGVNSEGRPA